MRLGILIVALTLNGFASSVVIIVKHNQIVIAADSKISLKDSNGPLIATDKTNCKIHQTNDFYWTAVGMDAPGKFDVASVVGRAGRTSGTLSNKMDQFVKYANRGLKKVIWSGEDLTVIFVKFTNGEPEFIVRSFVGTKEGGVAMPEALQVQCSSCPDKDPAYFGKMDDIYRLIKAHPELLKEDPVSLARRLVQEAISGAPMFVGPPIAELTITPVGSRWENPGVCSW